VGRAKSRLCVLCVCLVSAARRPIGTRLCLGSRVLLSDAEQQSSVHCPLCVFLGSMDVRVVLCPCLATNQHASNLQRTEQT